MPLPPGCGGGTARLRNCACVRRLCGPVPRHRSRLGGPPGACLPVDPVEQVLGELRVEALEEVVRLARAAHVV